MNLKRRLAYAGLLLALVLAPLLGRLHQLAHAGQGRVAIALASTAIDAGAEPTASISAQDSIGFLESLFHEHGSSDCLLLDMLSAGDGLVDALPVLSAIAPGSVLARLQTECCFCQHVSQFQARGPPLEVA